jgi:hypothetical protein
MDNFFYWLFSGLWTQIISHIVITLFGGLIGYKIGIRRSKGIQSQNAGHNSNQTQIDNTDYANIELDRDKNVSVSTRQSQKAGNNSTQTQIIEKKVVW